MAHLLERAQARNLKASITGVLLYSEGAFMQYLEGTEEDVSYVMRFIYADPLHHRIFVVLKRPIERREFADWSMAFRSFGPGNSDLIRNHEESEALTERLTATSSTSTASRHLLTAFWNVGRSQRDTRAFARNAPRFSSQSS
jgi:hypothetical protein